MGCPAVLVCLMFSQDSMEGSGKETAEMICPSQGITCITLTYSVGDITLDHLLKMASAGFLHCKPTVFPFVITKYF